MLQAEDGIRDVAVTGVQTCALPIWLVGLLVGVRVVAFCAWVKQHQNQGLRLSSIL